MRALQRRLLFLPLLLTLACATTPLDGRERHLLGLRYIGNRYALKQSFDVAPFFRDDSRRLLSRQPPGEVELVVAPSGKAIAPGPKLEVLPAGTRIRVLEVSFPTRLTSFGRPWLTPRERIWVELAVDGRPVSPSYVLLLRPDIATEEEVIREVERLLTPQDLASELAGLSAADQEAVRTRVLAPGMTKRGLELAMGPPYQQKVQGSGADVTEQWMWRTDLGPDRFAHLVNGVVVRVEEETVPVSAASAAPASPASVPQPQPQPPAAAAAAPSTSGTTSLPAVD